MKKLLIKNPLLKDPSAKLKNKADILIENGKISKISPYISPTGFSKKEIIDAEGLIAFPGLVDAHVHTRVPGGEDSEDFLSLSRAALSGGVTSVLAMPNTLPPQDNPFIIKKLSSRAKRETPLNIYFTGCISKNRKGEKQADLKAQLQAGATAFTDDGSWTEKETLMEKALVFSRRTGVPVLSHCQFPCGGEPGVIGEGEISRLKKLPGIPAASETMAAARDILLALKTSGRLHIQHISRKETLELLKEAKMAGLRVTGETCPHYLHFTEKNLSTLDPNFKMNPPLGGTEDRESLLKALKTGVLDFICSDHAPHPKKNKKLGLLKAPFGIIGLETLLAASLDLLFHKEKFSLEKISSLLSSGPAQFLGLEGKGSLRPGSDADIALLNPDFEFRYEKFYSKSSNSPFSGMRLKGKNAVTILGGRKVYENGKFYL